MLPSDLACAQVQPADSQMIRETGQGQFAFPSDEISELSGITYYSGDWFAVVSDKGGKLGNVTIEVDRETGAIIRATLEDTIALKGGRDLEDLAIHAGGCLLLAVDEADQSLVEYHAFSHERIGTVPVPDVFKKARPNLGFESLSAMDGLSIWAANEEPLTVDGPRATNEAGGLIRLQHFGPNMEPDVQYAYRVDPHRGSDNFIKRAQSGVSGLVALPNGRLIVMERELGGSLIPSFRTRLYLIDTQDATDTSKLDALTADNATPVRKQLLFESNTGLANFEGITLGPRLNNGDYALILVSDDGGGKRNPQNLLSLRIAGDLVVSGPEDSGANAKREPRRRSEVAGNLTGCVIDEPTTMEPRP